MADHWTRYSGAGLSEKQVTALDRMARDHEVGDGLDLVARANGISRSKAGKGLNNKHSARGLLDAAFEQYGR